ncbi:MAG: hypothetical protein ACUZ8H_13750 [Candidatus Anammoxibacter sp.]
MEISEEFKKAIKKEFKNISGILKIELNQGGVRAAHLTIKIK